MSDAPTPNNPLFDPLGRDRRRASAEAHGRSVVEKYFGPKRDASPAEPKRAPALAATPPGGSDDPPPAKPRRSKAEQDAIIARKHAELDAGLSESKARLARAKAERDRVAHAEAQYAEMDRLFKEDPAKFVERLSGGKPAALRDLFERSVKDQKMTPAEREAAAIKREVKELRQRIESDARAEQSRQQFAAFHHEVTAAQQRSDVLARLPSKDFIELVWGVQQENPGSTTAQVIGALEQHFASIAKQKPAPAPAPKPAPKKPPKPMSDAKAFVQKFRQFQKKGK